MFKRTLFLMKQQANKPHQLRALNVAEKPSVARTISDILSKRSANKMETLSMYNPMFNFEYNIAETNYKMNFTSVTGHLMNFEFPKEERKWELETIKNLFKAEITKEVKEGGDKIAGNLKQFGKEADVLILWLDCDREGENIAYEVIDLVKIANPKIKILRARFSSLTEKDITYSINNLEKPDKNISDAVDLRQKIDLIIGASFTRLQSISFLKSLWIFKNKNTQNFVISYGPCQFPTLNFILERADKIESFKKEDFYYIELAVNKTGSEEGEKSANSIFKWERERLFDKNIVQTIHEKLLSKPNGEITEVVSNPKTRLKPVPLNTVEMQKLISRKLKITSYIVMDIAEKLYQKGYISYPRTETQKYSPNEIYNLKRIATDFSKSNRYTWCEYAKKLLEEDNFYKPREGKFDDKAHPPIHPVRLVDPQLLTDIERKIYEVVCVHFLATLSQDAKGEETVVKLLLDEEVFVAKGVTITRRGYLDVYPYDTWDDFDIPAFSIGEKFSLNKNADLSMKKSNTSPPYHLTESELISLMDKHGIGTDSTIHEHIKHVKDRGYAEQHGSLLKPSLYGSALIKAYKKIGVELYKPYLRAAMERDMKSVCEGKKEAEKVYAEMKKEMEKIYDTVYEKIPIMNDFLNDYLKEYKSLKGINDEDLKFENGEIVHSSILRKEDRILEVKCPKCNENNMKLMENKNTNKFFMGCSGYPKCRNILSLENPISVNKTGEICKKCSSPLYELVKSKDQKVTKCLSKCFLDGSATEEFSDTKYVRKQKQIKEKGKIQEESLKFKPKPKATKQVNEIAKTEVEKKKFTKGVGKIQEAILKPIKQINEEAKMEEDQPKKKKCVHCGIEGRHTANSNCPGVIRKKKKSADLSTQTGSHFVV